MPHHERSLLDEYSRIGLSPPSWAYPLEPSIPFIGRNYDKCGRVLVYASAENLSHYRRKPDSMPAFLRDDRRLNRHRAAYEVDPGGFFPSVHMAPFEDGSLLVAAWFYLRRCRGEAPDDPRELLESIAAANFCKFSIENPTNVDYAEDRKKQTASLPYVKADLKELQPECVILPRSIWKVPSVAKDLRSLLKREPLALPQFNPRVVHMHLQKHEARAKELESSLGGTPLPFWIARMKGYKTGSPYRFLAEIEEVIDPVSSKN